MAGYSSFQRGMDKNGDAGIAGMYPRAPQVAVMTSMSTGLMGGREKESQSTPCVITHRPRNSRQRLQLTSPFKMKRQEIHLNIKEKRQTQTSIHT